MGMRRTHCKNSLRVSCAPISQVILQPNINSLLSMWNLSGATIVNATGFDQGFQIGVSAGSEWEEMEGKAGPEKRKRQWKDVKLGGGILVVRCPKQGPAQSFEGWYLCRRMWCLRPPSRLP